MKGSTRDGMVEECRSRSPAAAMQSLGAHRVCIRDVEAGAGARSTKLCVQIIQCLVQCQCNGNTCSYVVLY